MEISSSGIISILVTEFSAKVLGENMGEKIKEKIIMVVQKKLEVLVTIFLFMFDFYLLYIFNQIFKKYAILKTPGKSNRFSWD